MEIRICLDNGSYSDFSEWYDVDNAVGVAKFASELLKWAFASRFRGRKFQETPSLKFQFRNHQAKKPPLF